MEPCVCFQGCCLRNESLFHFLSVRMSQKCVLELKLLLLTGYVEQTLGPRPER